MHGFLKNLSLLLVCGGFFMLPLVFSNLENNFLIAVIGLISIIFGYTAAAYYHKKDIHASQYTWFVGLPLLTFFYLGVIWYLSIPWYISLTGIVLFVLHLPAGELLRKLFNAVLKNSHGSGAV